MLDSPMRAQPFLDAARQIDANNYRLHAILAGLADSEDRTCRRPNAEYKLALDNLPARVPEGPLYPIELRLNLYEVYVRQDDCREGQRGTAVGDRRDSTSSST